MSQAQPTTGYTVIRGRFLPDGSLDFVNPTCFPVPPTGCLDDHLLVLSNATVIPAYAMAPGDGLQSYATTPPRCPASRRWTTTVDFFWSDGSIDNVVTRQPCRNGGGDS